MVFASSGKISAGFVILSPGLKSLHMEDCGHEPFALRSDNGSLIQSTAILYLTPARPFCFASREDGVRCLSCCGRYITYSMEDGG